MKSNSQTVRQSNNSHRGFTVLELLVASLLLGMLMTILTMIFNQSSIAWKTGVAGVADMDDAREDVSDLRYKADNVYMWDGEKYIHGIFDEKGQIWGDRNSYINENFSQTANGNSGKNERSRVSMNERKTSTETGGYGKTELQPPDKNHGRVYIVNVMSLGPDGKKETRYDNIYSVSPSDDPGEW